MPFTKEAQAVAPKPTATVNNGHNGWMITAMLNLRGKNVDIGWFDWAEILENKALVMLNRDQNQLTYCQSPEMNQADQNVVDARLAEIVQASVEGRLFIRHKDSGRLMQLRASNLKNLECDMELSAPMEKVPGVEGDVLAATQPVAKPESPSILTYILSWFSDKYAQIVNEYNEKRAAYEAYKSGTVAVPAYKAQPQAAPQQEQAAAQPQPQPEEEHTAEMQAQALQAQSKTIDALHAPEDEPEEFAEENEAPEKEAIPRGLKEHNAVGLANFLKRVTYPQEAVPKGCAVNLTGEQFGVLAALALANGEMSIQAKSKGEMITFKNDPAVNYPKVVVEILLKNNSIRRTDPVHAFRKMAAADVQNALKTNDYDKLGKMIADGLKLNNKMLQEQRTLSNSFTAYAMLGSRVLGILNANPALKNVVVEKLGPNSKDLQIAQNAKNISDLRISALQAKDTLSRAFQARDAQGDPVYEGTDVEVAKVCQLSYIEVKMNQGTYDLSKSLYSERKMYMATTEALKGNPELRKFRLDSEGREAALEDPVKMANLFKDAIKANAVKQNAPAPSQPQLNMQNEPMQNAGPQNV